MHKLMTDAAGNRVSARPGLSSAGYSRNSFPARIRQVQTKNSPPLGTEVSGIIGIITWHLILNQSWLHLRTLLAQYRRTNENRLLPGSGSTAHVPLGKTTRN
jgi:hypothetical protein